MRIHLDVCKTWGSMFKSLSSDPYLLFWYCHAENDKCPAVLSLCSTSPQKESLHEHAHILSPSLCALPVWLCKHA